MKTFRQTVEIQAAPGRVWPVLIDVERWPEWTPSMTSVRRLDSGPFGIGSRAHIRQPKLAPAVWEVTEFEPQRNFTWVSRHPGVCAAGRHLIEARTQGSRVTLSVEFTGVLAPLIALLTGALTARYVAMETDGLKQRSERRV